MSDKIFINLAVSDLAKSRAFYTGLGFTLNPKFSNDSAASVTISEHIHIMLLTKPFFASFTPRPVADTLASVGVINCLSFNSRAEVEALIQKAHRAGASSPMPPKDHGFMYQHGFEDPDGHVWEAFYMDESKFPGA